MQDNRYKALQDVLDLALEQAASGKGAERHASGEAFEKQKICQGAREFGVAGPLFQAWKKIQEAHRMAISFEDGRNRAVRELLGAINYVAAAVIVLREGDSGGS